VIADALSPTKRQRNKNGEHNGQERNAARKTLRRNVVGSSISIIYGLVIGRVKDLWSSARVVVLQKIGLSLSKLLSE